MARTRLSETAGKDMRAYVEAHLGQRLRYQTIDRLCGTTSSNEVFSKIVGPLMKDGVIVPTNKKLIRGNDDCPIFQEYQICDELPDELTHSGGFMVEAGNSGILSEELASLSPALTENGYLLLNPKATIAWIDELRRLGSWLDDPSTADATPALPEERSFEIFRNEKLLNPRGENRKGRTLLELINGAGVFDRLRIYEFSGTELPYYRPRRGIGTINILVVENHVPFVRICDLLDQGVRKLFGVRIDAVIYGSGFAVLADGALANTERLLARKRTVRRFYWGDIDRPGMEVYERLAESVDIRLLVGAYEAMIDAAEDDELPHSGGQRLPEHMGVALAARLNERRLETYLRVLASDLRIPQEAVSLGEYAPTRKRRKVVEADMPETETAESEEQEAVETLGEEA